MIKREEIFAVQQEISSIYCRVNGSYFILEEILKKSPRLKDLILWKSKLNTPNVTLEEYVRQLSDIQRQLSKCSRALYALVQSAPEADNPNTDDHATLDELVSRYDKLMKQL